MNKEILEKLKAYFASRDEIVMAFLFGSRSKGNARASSDWDIGVYLTSESRDVEQGIWLEVERICGTEVDLIVLNRAAPRVAWSIMRGEPLVIKDRKIYLDVLTNTSHDANDWYRTAEDYHRVFERSSSLSREDRSRLEKIIQFVEVETSDFPKFEKMTWDDYSTDRSKKREIERWAEQIMNAVIDVAEIILASERRVIPETYTCWPMNIWIIVGRNSRHS
ncbi:MAG: nucleotidyltransferase domain-containing protein [Candidatus Vogelbacteria bacterium]|nr:nucleotidyltransferase domain-containing protein [Candidatus Vogelbacteria bacterium]